MFQPTHPHGVRRALISHVVPGEMFQPTHPHGVRRASRGQGVAPCQVSTHAPARGATGIRKGQEGDRMSFNPRTRTGCDCAICTSPTYGNSFNPRTRTGCDAAALVDHQLERFQPTHPHGVRLQSNSVRLGQGVQVFNHAPARVRRVIPFMCLATNPGFQLTHPHGVRHYAWRNVKQLCFNPRTCTGAAWTSRG